MAVYNIHDILVVKTNIENIFPRCFLQNESRDCDMEIVVETSILLPHDTDTRELMPGVFLQEKKNILFSQFNVLGVPVVVVAEFQKRPVVIRLSRSYALISSWILRMPVGSLYPFEHFIKLLLQLQLLQKGYSFLIAAGATDQKNGTVLITGFGGMGKTSTWLAVLQSNKHIAYVGDDTVITNGQELFSYPKHIRLRTHGTSFFSFEKHKPPEAAVVNVQVNRGTLSVLFFLERGSPSTESVSKQTSLKRLVCINRKILSLESERFLLGAQYAGLVDLDTLRRREYDMLRCLVQAASAQYVIRAKDAATACKMIQKILL